MAEKVIEPSLPDTISDLRRKLKTQTMQFTNEKLLLEHKNELLKQELLELKERELNQAKLHESMFNKILNQTNTDPNEFINKQLDLLKNLSSKELTDLKSEIGKKNKKISELTEQLSEANDKLNKIDSEHLHKSREMELTIRELELNIKMLEEDKERVECENTLLMEELVHNGKQEKETQFIRKQSKADLGQNESIKQMKQRINDTLRENSEAKRTIDHLRNKSKKLKNSLQKAESINNHNIRLLQTQYEKEQNKWEKEKNAHLQEIHILKRKTINLHHLLQKYQHNELLVNNSCWSCSYTHTSGLQRTPFSLLNQCNDCLHKRQTACCNQLQINPISQ